MIWSDSYSIGCERVDAQHQELCHLVDELESNIGSETSGKTLAEALKFVVNYTRHHFNDEEKLMKVVAYPRLEEHKKLHNDLIHQVTEILLQLRDGKKLEPVELLKFLTDWVKNHIIEEDKKIGNFLVNRKFYQEEIEKKKLLSVQREAVLVKFQLLRDLYRKKMISADDVKEKKTHILVNRGKELGLANLRDFIDDLQFYRNCDFLCESDQKRVLTEFLESQDFTANLQTLNDTETKLLYIRTLYAQQLISEPQMESCKDEILAHICP